MKHLLYILTLVLAIAMTGCKESQWMDWKTQNELWLQQNAQKPGVVTTESGLQYKIIADPNPSDARPQADSYVAVSYIGKLINGNVFDQGQDIGMSMQQVVAGFSEGLRHIHTHGDIEVYIPWQLGYLDTKDPTKSVETGTEGTSTYIPMYSTMIFYIHLESVN